MLRRTLFLIFFLLMHPHHVNAMVTPLSLGEQNQLLKTYHRSGKYLQEVEGKLAETKLYLDRQLQKDAHLAIILDIDETALSNYPDLERMSFIYDQQAFTGAYMSGQAPAITPILDLYQHAIAKGIAVFFISERPNTPEITAITTKNLKNAGYDKIHQLILKPLENNYLSISDFKTQARHHIAALGYDILLNVGDQEVDLKGGYAAIKIKIPNPFYKTS